MITSRSSGSKESKEWEGFLGKDGRLVVVVVVVVVVIKKAFIYLSVADFSCGMWVF